MYYVRHREISLSRDTKCDALDNAAGKGCHQHPFSN